VYRHATAGEDGGDDDRAGEIGTVGERRIVREPDEADVARPDKPPVVEADPAGIRERDQVDREQEHQARKQEPASGPAGRHTLVRRYFPRIRFVPASISFSAASRVSSPAVSLPAVPRRFSCKSAYSPQPRPSFLIFR